MCRRGAWHHSLVAAAVLFVGRLVAVDANFFTLYRVPQWNYWSLASCEQARNALSGHENDDVRRTYRNFLEAAKSDMQMQIIAARLNKYESATKLSDYFPTPADYCDPGEPCNPEDRDVALGAQKIFVEGGLNLLFPTSFFQMALDLLKFSCNANRFQSKDLDAPNRFTDPLSPFADMINNKFPEVFRLYRKLTIPIWRLRGGQTTFEFIEGEFNGKFQFFTPDSGPYSEPVGGFPLAVIRAANKLIQILQKGARALGRLLNLVGAGTVASGIGLIDRQLELPKGLLRRLEEGIRGKICQKEKVRVDLGGPNKEGGIAVTAPTIVQLLLWTLRILEILRTFFEVVSNIMTVVVSRVDSRRLNRSFSELLELADATCEIQEIRVPNGRDPGQSYTSVIEFFEDRVTDADTWINEVNAIPTTSNRRVVEDEFEKALSNFQEFNEGILTVFDGFDNVTEAIKNIYLSIPLGLLQSVFIGFPTVLSDFTNALAVAVGPFEEASAFLSNFVERIPPIPSFPFSLLSTFVELVIDPILENVFNIDLDGIVGWLTERLGLDFDIPDINFDPVSDMLDTIMDSLLKYFDFEVGLNLTGLVPDLPVELQGFFDYSTFLNATFGFLGGFSTTPADAFDDYHDILGLQLGVNVTSVSNRLVDKTNLTIKCQTNWTAVMAEATFSSEECEESLTGLLRFPCDTNVSTCQIDVADLLRVCTIPEPDELFNEHLGLPSYYFRSRHICLRNIEEYKIVPVLIEGDSTVTVEELPTLESDVFLDNFDPNNIDMSNYSDTFIRQGYEVTDVSSNDMICSSNDRLVFVYKVNHIDPCVNGDSFPYTRQANREGMTDLCGYKVLHDHAKFSNCNGYNVVDPKRTSDLAVLNFPSGDIRFCWSDDLTDCPNPDNGPCGAIDATWELVASNIERCELSVGRSEETCLFFNYFGLNEESDITSTQEKCGSGDVCPYVYDSDEGLEACNDDTFNVENAVPGVNFQYASNRQAKSLISCDMRNESEYDLQYDRGGFVYQPPDRTWNPYDAWLDAFNILEQECGDSFSLEGKIKDECNGKPICNLVDVGCLPAEWFYACVSHRDLEPNTTRTYLFEDGDSSYIPQIQCPIQNVTVNGIETEVKQYIEFQQVLEADPTDIFTWIDKTDTVRQSCQGFAGDLGPVISNFCRMTPANSNRFPPTGKVWEIDYQCKCSGGFEKDPVNGICQACAAGQYRPGFINFTLTIDGPGGVPIVFDNEMAVSNITDCTDCPPGSYTDMEGSEECIPCPLGFATSDSGSTECKACHAGTHSENNETTGSTSCDYCEAGEYQDEEGQWACKLVSAGYFQPDEGEFTQLICPSGTFSPEGAANCTKCSPGFYAPREGTPDSCLPCVPGSYATTTGSSECRLCEQGYFSDEYNSTSCKKCSDGLTTQTQGAMDVSQCVPSFDAEALQARLKAGSSDEYNSDIMEDLPDNGFANRTVTQVSIGCRKFLIDYTPGVTNETVENYLREIGNGQCSPILTNVKCCAWDGLDCCPQTCEISPLSDYSASDIENDPDFFDALKLTGACFWREFACRDPDALTMQIDTVECNTRRERNRRGLSEAVSTGRQEFRREYFSRERDFYARRRLDENDTATELVGNGVCDPELNNEDNIFDGGDCCPQSCRVNDEFRSLSCTPLSFDVPFEESCDTGYGCCDPLILNRTFEETDVSPPIIETVPDYKVQYDRSVNYSLTLGNGMSPYPPVVKDNDECFDPNTNATLTVNEVERMSSRALGTGGGGILCGGPIDKFQYIFNAADAAGNVGEGMLTVFLVDEEPPELNCTDITLVASGNGEAELPVWSADDAGQGLVEVSFSSSSGSLVIADNKLTGIDASDESVMLMAHADDGCGNVATCQFVAMLTRTEPPSMMPSANPSDVPSNVPSSIPSDEPSNQPSVIPSDEPSNQPSVTPSDMPSVAPSDMPSMQPSATLELEIELSSIKGSASKFFASDKKKFKVKILSSTMYSVELIKPETLRCGITGNEAAPLKIKTKDVNKDGLMDWEVTFQADQMGFGDNLMSAGVADGEAEDNVFGATNGMNDGDDYITIILMADVLSLGRFIASEQLYIGTGKSKSKSDKSVNKSSKGSMERRLRG